MTTFSLTMMVRILPCIFEIIRTFLSAPRTVHDFVNVTHYPLLLYAKIQALSGEVCALWRANDYTPQIVVFLDGVRLIAHLNSKIFSII